jgi:addiction module HigA family antidote
MARVLTHPGEVLQEEYLAPLGLSARALGEAIGVASNRLTEIIRGRRGMSADTANRLGRYFDTDPRFWLNLQIAHDLSKAAAENDYSGIRTRSVGAPSRKIPRTSVTGEWVAASPTASAASGAGRKLAVKRVTSRRTAKKPIRKKK